MRPAAAERDKDLKLLEASGADGGGGKMLIPKAQDADDEDDDDDSSDDDSDDEVSTNRQAEILPGNNREWGCILLGHSEFV